MTIRYIFYNVIKKNAGKTADLTVKIKMYIIRDLITRTVFETNSETSLLLPLAAVTLHLLI